MSGATGGNPIVDLLSGSWAIRTAGPTSPISFFQGKLALGSLIGSPFVPAGSYVVRVRYQGSLTSIVTVNLTVLSEIVPPFPTQLGSAGIGLVEAVVAASAIGGNQLYSSSTTAVCKGNNVTLSIAEFQTSGSPVPRLNNITVQFLLFGPGQPNTGMPIGGQVFSSTGNPTATLDTTTLADGTYMVGCQIIDSADTTGPWLAYQIKSFPSNLIVMNIGPQSPVGTYTMPCASLNQNGHCNSGGVDFVPYVGNSSSPLITPNDAVAYPDIGTIPPVYSTSIPFNPAMGGTPSNTRTAQYWGEALNNIRYFEYKTGQAWGTTTVGGVMVQPWNSEATNSAETVEGSYPSAAGQSYLAGSRTNNQTTGNSTIVATPDVGPFSAYHWTVIELDGGLYVMNFAGEKLPIAGPTPDPTMLQLDKVNQPGNGEFPNTVQVGTISPATLNTFGGFGGGANDVVWDPRAPGTIAYVAQPIDHCIICIDFRTQTIDSVTYGPSNPYCYRYAGYKGGILGDGAGGYVDAQALGSVITLSSLVWSSFGGGTVTATTSTAHGLTETHSFNIGQAVPNAYNGGFGCTVIGTNTFTYSLSPNPGTATSPGSVQLDDGAQLNGPYSIQMQKRTDVSGQPQGTMYVADNYNCLIRSIAPMAIPSAGTLVTAGAVTTMIGLAGGAWTPPAPSRASPPTAFAHLAGTYLTGPAGPPATGPGIVAVTASSYSDNGDGTFAVVLSSPPTPLTPAVGWMVTVLLDGSVYRPDLGTYGKFPISAFTDSQHFTIDVAYPGAGHTVTIWVFYAEFYSSPSPVSFADAYVSAPQVLRMTSAGDIVLGEAWYNIMARRISFSTGMVSRIGPTGSVFEVNGIGWGWLDVDDGWTWTNGPSTTYGACGVLDDIVQFKMDSNPGSADYAYRRALDGSYAAEWYPQPANDFPSEGQYGVGHYPWAFCFSRAQFRMFSFGRGATGGNGWRPYRSGVDPDGLIDGVVWFDSGVETVFDWANGTCDGIFPYGLRPSFKALYGQSGQHWLGANSVPTIDNLPALYPKPFNTSGSQSGTMAGFLQSGAGGAIPRPELSMDTSVTPNVPGRALARCIYFVNRQALTGSFPTEYPPLFFVGAQGDNDGSGILITAGTWPTDCTRPVISGLSINRMSSTSINVQWTTDKACISLVCAGTPNSAGTAFPYNLWSPLETSYSTSHNITISNLPTGTIHINLVSKDMADNWNSIADVAVGPNTLSPDGGII